MKTNNTINYSQILILIIINIMMFSCQLIVNDNSKDDHVNNTNHSAVESFNYEIDASNRNYFLLDGINGNIEIAAVENLSKVKIWGERRVESDSKSDALEHLDELQVDITENSDHIAVKTDQPKNNEGRNYSIDYHIEVPTDWMVNISNVNGEIDLNNLKSAIKISVVNGNVELRNCEGNIDVDIVNGSFNGDIFLPAEADCLVGIVNGSISLEIPKNSSAQFSAGVVNGSISVNGLALTNIVSSPVKMVGTLGSGVGNIDLRTVNGSIAVSGF